MKPIHIPLSSALSKHFEMHRSRIDTFAQTIFSLIKMSSVQLMELAQGFNSQTKTLSTVRKLQRFFQFQEIDEHEVIRFILSLFPVPQSWTLTLDRTNWKFGAKDINFLVLAFVYKGISIPLAWELINHKGNSHTKDRLTLMKRALQVFSPESIHCLLADREFIGQEWFQFLIDHKINFCIRIKESTQIRNHYGVQVSMKEVCRPVSAGQRLSFTNIIWGHKVQLIAFRLPDGKLLILAAPLTFDAFSLDFYRKRWTIEVMFKSLKTNGFNFERTHLASPERLSKLMVLCAIAFVWSVKIGDIKNDILPIKIKNHGRPLFSIFTYGFDTLKTIFNKSVISKFFAKLFNALFNNEALDDTLSKFTVVY
jgi:Transposase DDE domain